VNDKIKAKFLREDVKNDQDDNWKIKNNAYSDGVILVFDVGAMVDAYTPKQELVPLDLERTWKPGEMGNTWKKQNERRKL